MTTPSDLPPGCTPADTERNAILRADQMHCEECGEICTANRLGLCAECGDRLAETLLAIIDATECDSGPADEMSAEGS